MVGFDTTAIVALELLRTVLPDGKGDIEDAKKIKLDAIICNAGIMALPKLEKAFGYELQFFTNHIGHFMLVTGLIDSLTEDGRVVMLSSGAHSMAGRPAARTTSPTPAATRKRRATTTWW